MDNDKNLSDKWVKETGLKIEQDGKVVFDINDIDETDEDKDWLHIRTKE